VTDRLLVPGAARADGIMTDGRLLAAMVGVEEAWLDGLAAAGIAPATARLTALVGAGDAVELARRAEDTGNPVVPLVSMLRERLRSGGDGQAAAWVHRGLTSQDVLDTALVLCLRDVCDRLLVELRTQSDALVRLAMEHRRTVRAARTITQHAVPTTFGLTAAGWLHGVLDAADAVAAARAHLPVQAGGAAGTMAATTALAAAADRTDPATEARRLTAELAARLGLADSSPWHTRRTPIVRTAQALVACTGTWGVVAGDVLVGVRPEVGELAEPDGHDRGGSSTMPGKRNPVLSTLIRAAVLRAPQLLAGIHLAAAEATDERPAGAWHAEWPAVQELAWTSLVAGSQATELITGLRVDAHRMAATADAASATLLAERAAMTGGSAEGEVRDYLGAAGLLIDEAVARARAVGPGAGEETG
jgi:3-carboxy-cis,cis-muconate cycloisomerase